METTVIIIFILGYLAIALEHPLRIDKAASALVLGVLCWAIFVLGIEFIPEFLLRDLDFFTESNSHIDSSELQPMFLESRLLFHLAEISSILFFLLGAMTIVETIDSHQGFKVITDRITTTNKVKLLWIVCILTFFLSAVLDNLTTTIVMVSLLRKLIKDKQTRWYFAGFVIIAANAGGAWSPIGDVTTTMLWIKKQIPHVGSIIAHIFAPSVAALVVPLGIVSFTMKGNLERPEEISAEEDSKALTKRESTTIFTLGILGLLFVPVFKTITHLPPFMGMMFSLAVLWIVTEIMHVNKIIEHKRNLSVLSSLKRIDMPSVLFFLGILLAVASLQEIGTLRNLAGYLDETIGNIYVINIAIGALSAIVDNVPLVAAAQGMYEIQASGPFAADGIFWLFLAYCAGTGGSILIIGSAAGIAAMGLEDMDFIWYLKKMSWLAIVGYLAGAALFVIFHA